MTNDKPTLALLMTADKTIDRYGYWHSKARLIELVDGKPRNISVGWVDLDAQLADFEITCQNEQSSMADGKTAYAFRGAFNLSNETVELRRAEAMVKTLKRIERVVSSFSQKYGAPGRFGAFVALVGGSLGVLHFVVEQKAPWDHTYATGEYQLLAGGEARAWLDRQEDEAIAAQKAAAA